MSFFSSLSLSRWIIVVMVPVTLFLGWRVIGDRARLSQVKDDLNRAPALVAEIQALAMQLNDLQRLENKEGLRAQENPEDYIRNIAQQDKVSLGGVDISPSTSQVMKGVEDRVYTIKPSEKKRRYSRGAIANFLYKLEADSRRVKVTSLKFRPPTGVKLRPGEIGPDVWTFEAKITSRQVLGE